MWQDWRRTHQDVHLLQMKRLSHSAVNVNNNNMPPTSAGCRACRGGSYSCSHCCAVCAVHGAQLDANFAAASDAAAASVPADDVFDDVPTASGGGGGGGAICGATAATLEDGAAAAAEK